MRGLESVKANAIALARFAPEALERLKAAHAAFGRAVETNQTARQSHQLLHGTRLPNVGLHHLDRLGDGFHGVVGGFQGLDAL